MTHAAGPEHPRSTPMTTPSDPPAPLTPAQQDAAFRPSHTPATPWPALAQALAEFARVRSTELVAAGEQVTRPSQRRTAVRKKG